MIRLENYSVYYKVKNGYAVAVDDVTLEIAEGEFLAIMGASGCGKTTLLRSILGLCEFVTGQLYYQDKPVDGLSLQENTVAYVSQEYVLYPHLSVYDNIAYPLRSSKMKQQDVDRLVRQMADAVGLGGMLTRRPKQLSGGQQQRLAIARALVKSPAVVLYDEPFSNVDATVRQELRQLIYDISRHLNQTVIYVTHDQEEATELADRIIWMEEGKLLRNQPKEIASRDGARKPAGFRLYATKKATQDYTHAMLPKNRKQVFWDVIKLQGWKLVSLGLVMLLFSAPIHFLALLSAIASGQIYTAELTQEKIMAMEFSLQYVQAWIYIPLLMLFAVGFAGAAYVIRQLAWGEPVTFGYDFKKGIRQNAGQMILLAAVIGGINCLCVYCMSFSVSADGTLASYVTYLPTVAALLLGVPVGAYLSACIPVYTNTFWQNIRLGLVLFLKAPVRTWGALLCTGGILALFWIPSFYGMLVGRVLVSLLIPVMMLGWYLYSYNKLDLYINPSFFPELVGRGVVAQNDPHE